MSWVGPVLSYVSYIYIDTDRFVSFELDLYPHKYFIHIVTLENMKIVWLCMHLMW